MLLNQLFKQAPEIEIQSINDDSRKKRANSLFFCVKGMRFDGHQFVQDAILNGAIAVVHSEELSHYEEGILYFRVDDVVDTFNAVANVFYGEPSHHLQMFGVTGTNGKSTTAKIIQEILNPIIPTGNIGSISITYGAVKLQPLLTTPTIIDLHSILKEMVDADMKAATLEVTSVGIEQKRVQGVHFDYAIFTNLNHDHLDFHGSMKNYFEAKKKFFDDLDDKACAIMNIDDPYGLKMVEDSDARVVTYGMSEEAMYSIRQYRIKNDGTSFHLRVYDQEYAMETNLVSCFNLMNVAAAIAALHEAGLDMEVIQERIKSLSRIEGRMEVIDEGQNFNILVDMANTVEGLSRVLEYATSITPKKCRIIIVNGSAGKKDKSKREKVGELMDQYCDMIILTEDDPRNESPRAIAEEIAKGIKEKPYLIISDRYDAIRQALELADPEDTVLVLGKGNQKFMERDIGRYSYQGDVIIIKEVLKKYVLIKEGEDYEFEQIY
ncbi:UDP-N-acetylmuramoyl-L-alanyl-D-glutamate--2,6-diaminopimelate ligase [Bulleidia sp. zg-1006]|uniref:UDP-N-acetylmuramoyl-L-alanyl-D-glutamate--2, 6-diaminopimelate ligase n=1 Tax=Bacillati TaxID=1783272 RepID=UPI001939276C|nr:UDP-N-acetylmuramoyl-L-alanyl-D-glutamate--2,6-diaminopimelate ligase [Bulleidia sp. zg-1006]MBW9212378.1 UDP-N-acetylmuramoyl-L-alanyl-D-glutamate--2,6-diaminopimelate ligase [Trueperella sp. zg.1013]QRG86089.1 UDP-N-acetylmuramoyl-L-alanyl-D-glutamate--2,6-diaminopimelate ligase [Bulleidia sp. zg-1006]